MRESKSEKSYEVFSICYLFNECLRQDKNLPTFLFMELALWQGGLKERKSESVSCSVSDSLWPRGLWFVRSSDHGILQARICSGEPLPSPGDLPDPGIKPGSLALQADSLPSEPPGKPTFIFIYIYIYTHTHTHTHNMVNVPFEPLCIFNRRYWKLCLFG